MTGLLAPVVGAISGVPEGAASALLDQGAGYDFAIGGLGFHFAISDERKYERATAQFRKEQFDTSDSPGDQSLVGFWTKGQLSFHDGAGSRYSDVTGQQGGTDNRYWSSGSANPFVKGEVTLYPEWGAATLDTYTGISDVQPVGTSMLAVLADGAVTYGALGAAGTAYSPGPTVLGIACGGGNIYCAMSDNSIHRITDLDTTPAAASIYTHTAGLSEIHYAKDRLFVMDADGVWYQLAPNPSGVLPVAMAAGDQMFTATTVGDWCVTDTPGPVLFANGSRVFAVTQDADGLYPTLTAPIQVADLPIGENVIGIAHYLGFVVLVTTRGVRVAVLGDSGITYGPRLTEWNIAPYQTGVARGGESVYVAADHRIVEVNLASQIGDGLEFGWADLPTPFATETNYGVTQFDGKVVAWGGAVLDIQQDTCVSTGFLETSYHRFGTLEPKRFHTVKVRMAGAGGSITISKVDRNGTIVPLYTAPASEREVEVTLREATATDRLALRFTLTADAGVSPELLSYQLRALPAPRRQRMIRVPLMLHDVERRGSARAKGYTGSAWDRLRALEELEEGGATVLFQDFRTGESGLCFIEQVAHEGDTPPGRQSDGFGGYALVTIRKL